MSDLLYVYLLYSPCYNLLWGVVCMDIIRVFSQNVRKYRMQKGISQEELAEKANLHRTYISAVECARRSIALENIQRIADALEIETYLLFK